MIDFKKRVRNVVLTWFTEDLEYVKSYIEKFACMYDGLTYYIGHLEYTETEKKHSHILLCFKNAVTLGSVHHSFPNIHIEPCLDKKAYLHYAEKENSKVNKISGFYATNVIEIDKSYLPLKVDVYSLFIEDLDNGYSKKQLMRKYPSLFIRHFDNISKLINEYYTED